jgi:hypothetical protein
MKKKLINYSMVFYYLAMVITLLIIAGYFISVYYYSVNIPFHDDYTHLYVITGILDSNSFLEEIKLLFSLHNEHRITIARLITLAALFISGEINLVFLNIVGNFSLLGVGVILFLIFGNKVFQNNKCKLIYFLPVILLLFNSSYFIASIWTIAALSSLMVIPLSFLCLFTLFRFNGYWVLPLAFFIGVFSSFTQGNGLFVLYVGFFLLLSQRKYRDSTLWLIGTIIISFLYFYDYVNPEAHPSPLKSLLSLDTTVDYLFTFLGSWSNIPLFIGILFTLLFILLIFFGLHRKNITILGFLLFLFVSALSVAVARAGFGIEQALSPRYKIYSLLFFALLYMSLFEFLEKPWITNAVRYGMPGIFVFLLVFDLYTMVKISDDMVVHKKMLVDGLIAWENNGKGLSHWDAIVANQIITDAIRKDIYHLPSN